ncbi:MAG TPA: DUF4397 domain-containing protein [Piscinibacter sp.]|nr:DUF4397 domain-containing protein [Piscinibacter sp.]
MKITPWLAAAVALVPLLQACGGGSDSDGNGAVRLVNASSAYGALDLYSSDTLLSSAVAPEGAGSYVTLASGTYTLKVKRNGSSTTVNSTDRSVAASTSHTLLAYSTADTLRSVFLTDNETAPTSGAAKLRVFNASIEAGALDVYVTASSATLADSSPTVSALGTERFSSYNEISAGSYRVRVTGSGDKTDLRLDVDGISLADQRIGTLVLTTTPGGVLVNSLFIDQKSTVTGVANPSARIRLVAGAGSNGTVAATINGTSLSSGLRSPTVGAYALVPAGSLSGSVTLEGTALTLPTATLAAGSDSTLLVTSAGGAGTATLIADDNKPAITSTNAKLRLVHGVGALGSSITLTADYSAVATDTPVNSASTPAAITAGTDMRLEATTPTAASSLFLDSAVTLVAGKVYTLFMLGDANAPAGVLRRDR